MTILIVEDDPDVLTLTERLLVARGHTVLSAPDPHHASFVLAEHGASPDVLLTDLILAGHSGLEYAKSLKAAYPALRVVFMTGWVHRAPAAQRSGLGRVIHKPFTAEELYEAIDRA